MPDIIPGDLDGLLSQVAEFQAGIKNQTADLAGLVAKILQPRFESAVWERIVFAFQLHGIVKPRGIEVFFDCFFVGAAEPMSDLPPEIPLRVQRGSGAPVTNDALASLRLRLLYRFD